MRLASTVAAIGCALLSVATALAHAEPATVKPGHGAVVVEVPVEVVIVMSQDMARQAGASDIDVFDERGEEVTRIAAVIDNSDRRRISVPLPEDLAPGDYTVAWKTLSDEDGDADAGELSFRYDPAGTPDPGQEQLREDLVPPTQPPGDGDNEPGLPVAGNETGRSWVLVLAVGAAMFVLGGGAGYLFVQKRG
ncbi:MAG: copper resistance protein CopC [Dehalococcoidia bacterium]